MHLYQCDPCLSTKVTSVVYHFTPQNKEMSVRNFILRRMHFIYIDATKNHLDETKGMAMKGLDTTNTISIVLFSLGGGGGLKTSLHVFHSTMVCIRSS